MRRGTITILVVAALVALVPGLAMADNVRCLANADLCRGTNQSDTIRGSGDEDVIRALGVPRDVVNGNGGSDEIFGAGGRDFVNDTAGGDQDEVEGGLGDDVMDVHDNDETIEDPEEPGVFVDDEVVCGAGRDRVTSDPGDYVDPDTCEVGGDEDPEL